MENIIAALIEKMELIEKRLENYISYDEYISEKINNYIGYIEYVSTKLEDISTLTLDEYNEIYTYHIDKHKGLEKAEKLEKLEVLIKEAERNKKLEKLGF